VFGKVDTEAQTVRARVFGISSIPMLLVVREGVVLYAQLGALRAWALEKLIETTSVVDMDAVRA